ncbi:MAG: methionyl-tRNA formyltransferase, partial [Acidobacteria bacterium]|nr:methionyl-tRNA formyltransferase [Acidobacteriota bacterium]
LAGETADAPPGTLLLARKRRLLVACGGGSILELREIQVEGRKRISAEAFLNGQRLAQNESLGELNN